MGLYLSSTNNVQQSSWSPTQHVAALHHLSDRVTGAYATVNHHWTHTSPTHHIKKDVWKDEKLFLVGATPTSGFKCFSCTDHVWYCPHAGSGISAQT